MSDITCSKLPLSLLNKDSRYVCIHLCILFAIDHKNISIYISLLKAVLIKNNHVCDVKYTTYTTYVNLLHIVPNIPLDLR